MGVSYPSHLFTERSRLSFRPVDCCIPSGLVLHPGPTLGSGCHHPLHSTRTESVHILSLQCPGGETQVPGSERATSDTAMYVNTAGPVCVDVSGVRGALKHSLPLFLPFLPPFLSLSSLPLPLLSSYYCNGGCFHSLIVRIGSFPAGTVSSALWSIPIYWSDFLIWSAGNAHMQI